MHKKSDRELTLTVGQARQLIGALPENADELVDKLRNVLVAGVAYNAAQRTGLALVTIWIEGRV